MKKIISLSIAVLVLFQFLILPAARAEEQKSQLGSFEKQLDQPSTSDSSSSSSSLTAKDIATTTVIDMLMQFFMMGLMSTGTEDFATLNKELREEWSPALPIVRVEPAYQYVIGNVQGFSGKLEAGYLIVGADGEFTRYFEKSPKTSLNMINAHFLLRTIFTKHFGTNLALGYKRLTGLSSHQGFEFGLPLYLIITNNFIVDVLPYMAVVKGKDVYDLGGGLSFKYKFFGVRAGYRALFVDDQRIHGPRIGVFFQY